MSEVPLFHFLEEGPSTPFGPRADAARILTRPCSVEAPHRGISLIKNTPPAGPYINPVAGDLW